MCPVLLFGSSCVLTSQSFTSFSSGSVGSGSLSWSYRQNLEDFCVWTLLKLVVMCELSNMKNEGRAGLHSLTLLSCNWRLCLLCWMSDQNSRFSPDVIQVLLLRPVSSVPMMKLVMINAADVIVLWWTICMLQLIWCIRPVCEEYFVKLMKSFVFIDILIHYLVTDLFRCWMIIKPPGNIFSTDDWFYLCFDKIYKIFDRILIFMWIYVYWSDLI